MKAILLALTMIWITSCAGGGAISDLMRGNLGQPTRPTQSQAQAPASQVRPQETYREVFSRRFTPQLKSPASATIDGDLTLAERIVSGRGPYGDDEESKDSYSGSVELNHAGTRLRMTFTSIGEMSFDRIATDPRTLRSTLRSYYPIGLAIEVHAPADRSLEIDWSRVSLIDPAGIAYRVIHKGQRYAERDKSVPSSVVPPGSTLSDFIFPSELISYELRSWKPGHFFDRIEPGQSFGLFFPVKSGGTETQFHIVFLTQ